MIYINVLMRNLPRSTADNLSNTVEVAFVHCAKSIARSNIWQPENRSSSADVPSYAASTVAHAALSDTEDDMQKRIDDDFNNRMYELILLFENDGSSNRSEPTLIQSESRPQFIRLVI